MRLEKITLVAGSALLAMTLVAIYWQNGSDLPVIMAFAASVVIVVGSLFRYAERRSPEDERVRKIAAFAAMNSWLTAMLLFSGLISLVSLGYLSRLSAVQMLALGMFMMLIVFFCWYMYYSVMGDVE